MSDAPTKDNNDSTEVYADFKLKPRYKFASRWLTTWKLLEKAFESKGSVLGKITGSRKGGLIVDINGVAAFLPQSEVEGSKRNKVKLSSYIGRELELMILSMDIEKRNIVVSYKKTLFLKVKENFAVGSITSGQVEALHTDGVLIELDGAYGVVKNEDLCWGHFTHASDFVSPGQVLDFKVLRYDDDKKYIYLSLKQAMPDPWIGLSSTLAPGTKQNGRVVTVNGYGAFIALENTLVGLAHISDMTDDTANVKPEDLLSKGDVVDVVVLRVDEERRRIALSTKLA